MSDSYFGTEGVELYFGFANWSRWRTVPAEWQSASISCLPPSHLLRQRVSSSQQLCYLPVAPPVRGSTAVRVTAAMEMAAEVITSLVSTVPYQVAPARKIDLVFSVDPSSSMTEELAAMSADVFPAFATALRDIGGGLEDYRVAVIDGCPTPADFHTRGETTTDCSFQSGELWMNSSSTALDAEFSCVGDIYKTSDCSGANDDEQPIGAAIASLTPPFSTGENSGFLRDDALLVVVTITDEDECPTFPDCNDTSDAKATEIFNSLAGVKGDVRKMVYLGIGGGLPDGCPDTGVGAGAYGGAAPAILTNKVSQLFISESRGVSWDLCDGQLEDGLTEAIQVIEQACQDFPDID
ncbi:MAG: hypothetical protein GY811_21440 [Myxococcales bacterium]|nr:hypothetical protein [Myxococcales bacterium]